MLAQLAQRVAFQTGHIAAADAQQLCRFQLGQGRLPGQPVPQQQDLPLPRGQRFQQLPHPPDILLPLTAVFQAKAVLYHVR